MRIYPHSRALGFGEVLLLLVVVTFVVRVAQTVERRSERVNETQSQARATEMAAAIRNYEAEYGTPPRASDNAGFVRVLTRDNPRGIAFLNPSSAEFNGQGELVDAWGRPFEISIDHAAQPNVISPTMVHSAHVRRIGAGSLYQPAPEAGPSLY